MSSTKRARSRSISPVPHYVPWLNFLGIYVPRDTTCTTATTARPAKPARVKSSHDLLQHEVPTKRRKLKQDFSTFKHNRSDLTTQPDASPFMNLPAELRNEIYSYALCAVSHDTPLEITKVDVCTRRGRLIDTRYCLSTPCNLALGLLRTSWRVHKEASPILDGENKIQIKSLLAFSWKVRVRKMWPYIRTLAISDFEWVFKDGTPGAFHWMEWLGEFHNLERVELHFNFQKVQEWNSNAALPDPHDIGRSLYWHAFHPMKANECSPGNMFATLNRIQIFSLELSQADSRTIRNEVAYFISNFHVEGKKVSESYVEYDEMVEERFLEALQERKQCLEKDGSATSDGEQIERDWQGRKCSIVD